VFAAVSKDNELIERGGWDGEVEKPEQYGAILIDGCPLALHLRKRFALGWKSVPISKMHCLAAVASQCSLTKVSWSPLFTIWWAPSDQ
jgi:hypothetical protein